MKKDKPTGIVIIVLFVFFLSISIYGGVLKKELANSFLNLNKDFYFLGELYFYDDEGEFITTYECVTDSCGYAVSGSEEYLTYYYENGDMEHLDIINDEYVFLQDGDDVILYNLILSSVILTFEEIKFYNVENTGNYIFVKLDGLWGTFSLTTLSNNIEYKYDELSIGKFYNGTKLNGLYVYAKSGNSSYIVNNFDKVLSASFTEEVVDYTTSAIVTYNEYYNVFNYSGELILTSDFTYYTRSDNYFALVSGNDLFIYNNLTSGYIEVYSVDNFNEITILETEDGYEVYADDLLLES